MNSIDEVVEKTRLGLFIFEKIIQYGLGGVYYAVRNQAIKAVGLVTRKGYHEDTITGSPHHISRLGKESFVSCGNRDETLYCRTKTAACKTCPHR